MKPKRTKNHSQIKKKKKKLIFSITRGYVFYLSNAGHSGQSTVDFVNIKSQPKTIGTPLPELPNNVKTTVIKNLKKKSIKFNIVM